MPRADVADMERSVHLSTECGHAPTARCVDDGNNDGLMIMMVDDDDADDDGVKTNMAMIYDGALVIFLTMVF